MLLRAPAMLQRILRRPALPSVVLGPRDLAPFFRLAAARALVTGTAAHGAAPRLDMVGSLVGRAGGRLGGRRRHPKKPAPGSDSLSDSRNIVQSCRRD